MPRIINLYGGVDDHVVDDFGFKIPVCSEGGGGLTADGRYLPALLFELTVLLIQTDTA